MTVFRLLLILFIGVNYVFFGLNQSLINSNLHINYFLYLLNETFETWVISVWQRKNLFGIRLDLWNPQSCVLEFLRLILSLVLWLNEECRGAWSWEAKISSRNESWIFVYLLLFLLLLFAWSLFSIDEHCLSTGVRQSKSVGNSLVCRILGWFNVFDRIWNSFEMVLVALSRTL